MALRTCEVAVEVAHKIGLRGEVVQRVVPAWGIQESNWSAAAYGDAGEFGPLQIKYDSCLDVQADVCVAKDGLIAHLQASVLYLEYARGFGNGSWNDALSAYRVGPSGWSDSVRCFGPRT